MWGSTPSAITSLSRRFGFGSGEEFIEELLAETVFSIRFLLNTHHLLSGVWVFIQGAMDLFPGKLVPGAF